MAAWRDLPSELLPLVAEGISEHKDFLSFGSVCERWRFVMLDNTHQLPRKLPLCHYYPCKQSLPLLFHLYEQEPVATVNFLSLMGEKVYGGLYVPEVSGKWIPGSSHGWLVTIETHGRGIQLLNPFTRVQIELPSLSKFTHHLGSRECGIDDFGFVNKVILSSEPDRSGDCIVVALTSYMSIISFCRIGDERWTNVVESPNHLLDVIFYKGQVYAVTDDGSLVACDIANDRKIKVIAGRSGCQPGTRYLVESPSGELFQLVRLVFNDEFWKTRDFIVYKLEAVDESNMKGADDEVFWHDDTFCASIKRRELMFQWVKVNNLGDLTLFVGYNYSLSLVASSYPGCKANCIYFSDDHVYHRLKPRGEEDGYAGKGFMDMGVYNLEDKSIRPFGGVNYDSSFVVPPVWITPNPWKKT